MKRNVLANDSFNGRSIEGWELKAFITCCTPMMKCYIELKTITALSKKQLLRLKFEDIKPEGLHVLPEKLGLLIATPFIYPWSSELKNIISEITKLPRSTEVTHFFSNFDGLPYVNSRFNYDWKELMNKAISESHLIKSFNESDVPVYEKLRTNND